MDSRLVVETLFEPIIKLDKGTDAAIGKVANQLEKAITKGMLGIKHGVDIDLDKGYLDYQALQIKKFANTYETATREINEANKVAASSIEERLKKQQRIMEAQRLQMSSLSGMLKLVSKEIPTNVPGSKGLFSQLTKELVALRNESKKTAASTAADFKTLAADGIAKAQSALKASRAELAKSQSKAGLSLGTAEYSDYINAIKKAKADAKSLLTQTKDSETKANLQAEIDGYTTLLNKEAALVKAEKQRQADQKKADTQRIARLEKMRALETAVTTAKPAQAIGTVIATNDLAQMELYQKGIGDTITALDALRRARLAASNQIPTTATQQLDKELQKYANLRIKIQEAIAAKKTQEKESVAASAKISASTIKEVAALERLLGTFAGKDYAGAISSAASVDALQGIRRELTEQKRAYENINRAQKMYGYQGAMSATQVSEGIQRTSTQLNDVNARINRLTGGWAGLNNTVKQFFRYALFYGGMYQLLGLIGQLTGSVTKLQAAFKSIQAVTGATTREMEDISGAIKQVALSTQFSAEQIAAAALTLGQAGVKPANMQAVLQSTANFASAVGSTIETAADLITTFRDVYRDLDTVSIADKLTKAVNISKLTAEDLKTVVSISAQTAQDIGLSADQYLAAVSTMRNAGIKASTVATGLRQLMIDIFSANTNSLKILEKRYAELGERLTREEIRAKYFAFSKENNPLLAALEELQRIGVGGSASGQTGRLYEVRAMNALRALIGDLDSLRKNEAEINFGGAAANAAAIQMEALNNKLVRMGSAFTLFAEELTKGPVNALGELVDNITEALKYLTDLDLKLKSYGGKGLASDLGVGAAVGTIVGSVSGGGAIRKVATGLTAGVGATASGIGGHTEGTSTAETLGNVALVVSLIAALKGSAFGTAAKSLSGITKSTLTGAAEGVAGLGTLISRVSAVFSGAGFRVGLAAISLGAVTGLKSLLLGLVSFLGGSVGAAIIATGAAATYAVSQMPNLRRWFSTEIPKALEGILTGLQSLGTSVVNTLNGWGISLEGTLAWIDEQFARPLTDAELKESAKSLDTAQRATNQRIKTRLDEAAALFEPYKEYSLDSTAGLGDSVTKLKEGVAYQKQAITDFIKSLGSSVNPAALQRVIAAYSGILVARDKESGAGIEMMRQVAEAAGVNFEVVKDNNESLIKLLNTENTNRKALAATKTTLKERISATRGKSDDELIQANLTALATAVEALSEESVQAIENSDESNFDAFLESAQQILPLTFEAAKKQLDQVVEDIKSKAEDEGGITLAQQQLQHGISQIIAAYKAGDTVKVEKELKDMVLTQERYFKSLEETIKAIEEKLNEAAGKLPDADKFKSEVVGNVASAMQNIVTETTSDLSAILKDHQQVAKYVDLIRKKADEYGVDAKFMAALIAEESAGNAGVISKPTAHSRGGAIGLGQIMPSTAQRFGKTAFDMFDPEKNLDVMAQYLKLLFEMFDGNKALVVAAYNAGENNKAVKAGNIPNNPDTQGLVSRVMANYASGGAEAGLAKTFREVETERLKTEKKKQDTLEAIRASAIETDLNKVQDTPTGRKAVEVIEQFLLPFENEIKPTFEQVVAAWDNVTQTLGEVSAADRRQAKEKADLWAAESEVTKTAISDRLKEMEEQGASTQEVALVRSELIKIEAQKLKDEIANLDGGRAVAEGGENTDVQIATLKAQLANLYYGEMTSIRDYGRKRSEADNKYLQSKQELATTTLQEKLASAVAADDFAQASKLMKELLRAKEQEIALAKQGAMLEQDSKTRQIELEKLERQRKDIVEEIITLQDAELTALDRKLKEQMTTGARTPQEVAQFAKETGAGTPISDEEQISRLQSRIDAYTTSIDALNAKLSETKQLLSDTNTSEAARPTILERIKTLQDEINTRTKEQKGLVGELSDKATGMAQVWKTFAKSAADQINNLEESIGGQLLSAVNEFVDTLADAALEGKNLKETLTTFFASFFKQIATAIVKVLIFKAILGAVGAGSTTGKLITAVTGVAANKGGVIGYQKGGVLKAASGGLVQGASGVDTNLATILHKDGTRSPALLTKDEAILPAGMVKAIGVRNVQAAIDAYNRFGKIGFNQGGVVSGTSAAASGQTTVNATAAPAVVKIINVPGNSVVQDYLKSTEGESVVLNMLERNPNRVRRALGG